MDANRHGVGRERRHSGESLKLPLLYTVSCPQHQKRQPCAYQAQANRRETHGQGLFRWWLAPWAILAPPRKITIAESNQDRWSRMAATRAWRPQTISSAQVRGPSFPRPLHDGHEASFPGHEYVRGPVPADGIRTAISPPRWYPAVRLRSSPLQKRPASYQFGRRWPGRSPMAW
jgi:hypothetical protein